MTPGDHHAIYLAVQNPPQEKDMKCQSVIGDAMKWCQEVTGDHGSCLFDDILDLLPYQTIDPTWTYSAKLEAVSKCTLVDRGCCVAHDAACYVGKEAAFDVSGLPCPDFSTAGNRKMRAGVTNSVYLTHGRYVTAHRTPLLLTECTKDTGTHTLYTMLFSVFNSRLLSDWLTD